MKSPFTQFQGGGIEPNQNIAATGRYLGDMAQKSFADAGQQLAEGLKQYQKNAAEDDFLTETLSLQATDLAKWSSIISQDPKYAPMLDGLMPMMEKAGKGPSMSLNQKRALSSQLGAFLKAVPDDLRTIDTVAANQEKAAEEESESAAVAEALRMFVPQLDNDQNRQFHSQGLNIYNSILDAKTPSERKAATRVGKQFVNTLGSAVEFRERQLAQNAAAIAGRPDVMAFANAATPQGESSLGIGEIALTNSKGMPLSPQEAIAAFDAKVEEEQKTNPNYTPNPNARLQFLGSAVQGIQASDAPQAVKDEWSKYISMYAGELATRGTEMEALGKQTYGGYGTKTPEGALTTKVKASLPESVSNYRDSVNQLEEDYERITGPTIDKLTGEPYRSKKELAENRRQLKAKATKSLSSALIKEYWENNPNGNKAAATLYMLKKLQAEKIIDASGRLVSLETDKPIQSDIDAALLEAETWYNENDPKGLEGFNKEIQNKGMTAGEIGGWTAGGAAIVGGGAAFGLGKENWGVGEFGTRKYINKRNLRINSVVDYETKKALAARAAAVNAQTAIDGGEPLKGDDPRVLKDAQTEVVNSQEGKDLRKKYDITGKKGRLLTAEEINDPRVRSTLDTKKLAEYEEEVTKIVRRKLSPIASRRAAGKSIKDAVATYVVGATLGYLGTPSTTGSEVMDNYKQLFAQGAVLDTYLKEDLRFRESLKVSKKKVEDEVSKAMAGRTEEKPIRTPMSLPVQNALTAEIYKAATREDVITRTAEAINSTFGFSYSDARTIAEKFNPPSSTPQIVSMGGRDFLVSPDSKTGRMEYKELSQKPSADSMYFGDLTPTEIKNPDGSMGFVLKKSPKLYDKFAVFAKYPSWYTATQKEAFTNQTVVTNDALVNVEKLISALEEGGIRLTNREAAAKAASLAAAIKFGAVKSYGTPPISNLELEEIGKVTGTEDVNAILPWDKNRVIKLKEFRDALKRTYRSTVKSMSGNENQVIFLDESSASNSDSPVAIERINRYKNQYGTGGK